MEEVTAETFFRALKALDRFNGSCDMRVWLCQIAKNCYYSFLRKEKKLSALDSIPEQPDDFDTLRFLYETDDAARIHRIIHDLPEPYNDLKQKPSIHK